jgi:hypothetical protein
MGERWSAQELQNYRAIWQRQRPRLARLGGAYGNKPPKRPAVSVDLFGLTWREYSACVRRDEKIGIDERLEVLQKVGDYFHRNESFAEMTYTERRRIAGYAPERNPDWRAFGSMEGAGSFKGAIKRNDPDIARAIDAIPAAGPVVRQHYDQFVKHFRAALPAGGAVGTASRLLCMKRPD